MTKVRESGSQEVKKVKGFTSRVKKPTEFYVLGLFADKNSPLFELYGDISSRFNQDLNFFHTFETDEFLKTFKSDKVSVPSIIVYYHDLVLTKNEPKFRVFSKVLNFIFRIKTKSFKIKIILIYVARRIVKRSGDVSFQGWLAINRSCYSQEQDSDL
jgi:hypothetical protein